MTELSVQIADLEAETERLWEAAGRCRKIAVAAQVAIAGGGLILLLMIPGLIPFLAESLVVAIAAILGGIALAVSNQSSLDEIREQIRNCEARRTALIDSIELRPAQSAMLNDDV